MENVAKYRWMRPQVDPLIFWLPDAIETPLLICATLVLKEVEIDVLSEADSADSAAPVVLRTVYRNEAHDKLSRAQWQEERSDLAWLPP